MWTDKDGDYVLYSDHETATKEAVEKAGTQEVRGFIVSLEMCGVTKETQERLGIDETTNVQVAFMRMAERIAELEGWKEQQLAVESQWDIQAVGRAMNLRLGTPIRMEILPFITRQSATVERLEDALGELYSAASDCAVNEDSIGKAAYYEDDDHVCSDHAHISVNVRTKDLYRLNKCLNRAKAALAGGKEESPSEKWKARCPDKGEEPRTVGGNVVFVEKGKEESHERER